MSEAKQPLGVLFSDVFGVNPSDIEAHGALDISLVADLPLFIDPFLLFHSKEPKYLALHKEIIRYLLFLRDETVGGRVNDGLLKAWFYFKEVNQTWLGFSLDGNKGSGLGRDFATALRQNFGRLLDPDQKAITADYHLEKLCLIARGVGRDRISDFTTNLIKGFLCEFTEGFARKHLAPGQRAMRSIEKAEFDYTTRAWKTNRYELPIFNGDYVLLVPADILARDDTWINNSDLANQFEHLPASMSDDALRAQVNDYFMGFLPDPDKANAKDIAEARRKTLLQFPELVDYYIRVKEQSGDQAKSAAESDVSDVQRLFLANGKVLAGALDSGGFYSIAGSSYENLLKRAEFLKHVIENQDLYRIFWDGDNLLPRKESDVQLMFKLTWFRSVHDYNSEVNNGRGPVDGKASLGADDKSLIEFKLASNKKLKQNLEKQLAVYEAANQTNKSVKVIVYFTAQEEDRVWKILEELQLERDASLVLIDARRDNKPSGSTA